MKSLRFTLLLLLTGFLSLSSLLAKTWYTTGLSTEWEETAAWSLDSLLLDQRGIPAPEDHLVIRHPITLISSSPLSILGDLRIEQAGMLEIILLEEGISATLAGQVVQIDGMLTVNTTLQLGLAGGSSPRLILGPGAQSWIGGDLRLTARSQLTLMESACGNLHISQSLVLLDDDFRITGSGSWLAEAGVRRIDPGTQALTAGSEAEDLLRQNMSQGLVLYSDMNTCALGQRGLQGLYAAPEDLAMDLARVTVFPNPQTTQTPIHIEADGFSAGEMLQVEVRNLVGQTFHQQSCVASEAGKLALMPQWNLPTGTYLITIQGSERLGSQYLLRQ